MGNVCVILLVEMAQNTSYRSVPGTGLANTIRFSWREKTKEPFGRETFGRTILIGILKLKVNEVFCLQGNSLEGVFDVAFYTESKHDEVLKKVK